MNSFRIKSETLYVIEVNDDGDTVEFDTTDVSFLERREKAFRQLNKLDQELQAKKLLVDKIGDEMVNKYISKKEQEVVKYLRAYYDGGRKVIDGFLGEGASQKIFGDSNFLDMFNDLFRELEPHLKKANEKLENYSEELKKKYSTKEESDVLE